MGSAGSEFGPRSSTNTSNEVLSANFGLATVHRDHLATLPSSQPAGEQGSRGAGGSRGIIGRGGGANGQGQRGLFVQVNFVRLIRTGNNGQQTGVVGRGGQGPQEEQGSGLRQRHREISPAGEA